MLKSIEKLSAKDSIDSPVTLRFHSLISLFILLSDSGQYGDRYEYS